MSSIKRFEAYEILDCLGYPTLRGKLYLENGVSVSLDIPSPIFCTENEPVALRDGGERFLGYGMKKAAYLITEGISEKLKGVSVFKQKEIDLWLEKIDQSDKKENIGISTLLLVSLLVAKAGAKTKGIPLFTYLNSLYASFLDTKIEISGIPTIIVTFINGGKRINNPLNFKEFYFIPSSSFSFTKSLDLAVRVYHRLKEVLEYKNISTSSADSGGFSPNIYSNLDALEFIILAAEKENLKLGVDFFTGIDVGADDFFSNSTYKLSHDPQAKSPEEFYKFIQTLIKNFNTIYIEDVFAKKDEENWKKFMLEFGEYNYLAVDYRENYDIKAYEKIIKGKIANTIVFKLSRYPTLTSLFKMIDFCRKNNLNYVISQEINETNQSFISDLSVALQTTFIKVGAPIRGERVSKYNRLVEISKELSHA